MHLDAFTKRAGLSHQHPAPLAQGAVEGLHGASTVAAFGAAPVLPAGQNPDISLPEIREVPAARPPPVGRQLLPQAPSHGRAAVTEHPGHDAPDFALDGQPKPDLALLAAHKCPHLVQLQRRPTLLSPLFRLQLRQQGGGGQGFFWPTGNRHPRHARDPHNAALGVALGQQLVYLRVAHRLDHRRRYEAGLVPAGFALIARVAVFGAVAADVSVAALGAEMLHMNHKPKARLSS